MKGRRRRALEYEEGDGREKASGWDERCGGSCEVRMTWRRMVRSRGKRNG